MTAPLALRLHAVLLREGPAARQRCELYLNRLSPYGPWQVQTYAGTDGHHPERASPQEPVDREARAQFVAESIEAALRRDGYRRVHGAPAIWHLRALHDARDATQHIDPHQRLG